MLFNKCDIRIPIGAALGMHALAQVVSNIALMKPLVHLGKAVGMHEGGFAHRYKIIGGGNAGEVFVCKNSSGRV